MPPAKALYLTKSMKGSSYSGKSTVALKVFTFDKTRTSPDSRRVQSLKQESSRVLSSQQMHPLEVLEEVVRRRKLIWAPHDRYAHCEVLKRRSKICAIQENLLQLLHGEVARNALEASRHVCKYLVLCLGRWGAWRIWRRRKLKSLPVNPPGIRISRLPAHLARVIRFTPRPQISVFRYSWRPCMQRYYHRC